MRYLLIAAAVAATAATAQDLPKMKPGYWETTTTTASGAKGAPAQSSKTSMCVNDAVQKDIMAFSQNMGAACSKHSVRRDGNKFIGEAECAFGASMMKSQSVTTFTSDTAYRTESRSVMTPPMAGMSESHTVQEAKYMGACPAGMKPGDMTMAGRTVNISDMMKMMQKSKK